MPSLRNMRPPGRGYFISAARSESRAAATFAAMKLFSGATGPRPFSWCAKTLACAGATTLKTFWLRPLPRDSRGPSRWRLRRGSTPSREWSTGSNIVATISGVEYFNDSKATNVDATLKALDAFPGNVLVILGGKDKGSDYRILRQALRSHARMALLDRQRRGQDRSATRRASFPWSARRRWLAPWNSPHDTRGPATSSCWRLPARASTSSKISSSAGVSSSNSSVNLRKKTRRKESDSSQKLSCHSERSEESLRGLNAGTERFFASLRMTK